MDNIGTQLSDKMDATNAAFARMLKADIADMLKQSNANISMVLAKQVATGDQAKKRRGSVHSAADLAEIDRLKEELAQARANNAAIEEAKRHADENNAAGAAAAGDDAPPAGGSGSSAQDAIAARLAKAKEYQAKAKEASKNQGTRAELEETLRQAQERLDDAKKAPTPPPEQKQQVRGGHRNEGQALGLDVL